MQGPLRIPAEWEPHACCWLAFPHLHDEWLGETGLEAAQRTIAALCRTIAEAGNENVRLLVLDAEVERRARSEIGASSRVEYIRAPYGDCWTRDTIPLFGWGNDETLGAVQFRFNGWGGKFQMPYDAEVGAWVAEHTKADTRLSDLVIEGGGLEFDGAGSFITTDSCLRNANRNPGLSRTAAERALSQCVEAKQVIWLDRGLSHDHTDGHVDMVARFIAPGTVLCARPEQGDPDSATLQAIERCLRDAGLTVVTIPSPGLVEGPEGEPLPANYCNFYIANEAVIVPIWNVENDRKAQSVLEGAFPGRAVVGLRANDLLRGGGAFHCVTQPQPHPEP